MTSRFLDRIRAIISAEVSAFLDAQRDTSPSISEDDRILAELRADLGAKLAQHYQISKRQSEHSADLHALDQKAEFALEQGREDLAKAALMRKFSLKSDGAAKQTELDRLSEEIAALEGLIATMSDPSSQDSDIDAKLEELERLLARTNEMKG